MAAQNTKPNTGPRRYAGHEALFIAELQCIHLELRAKLASAAQIPTGKSCETALMGLSRDIDALAQKFLRLSEKLLDGGGVAAQNPRGGV